MSFGTFGQTHTTRWLRDLRLALPREIQHLVREARRWHNDRKPRHAASWRPNDKEPLAHDELPEDEQGYGSTDGYYIHEYGAEKPYRELPDWWFRTTKAELYAMKKRREAERSEEKQRELDFLEQLGGPAHWFEAIRDVVDPREKSGMTHVPWKQLYLNTRGQRTLWDQHLQFTLDFPEPTEHTDESEAERTLLPSPRARHAEAFGAGRVRILAAEARRGSWRVDGAARCRGAAGNEREPQHLERRDARLVPCGGVGDHALDHRRDGGDDGDGARAPGIGFSDGRGGRGGRAE